MDELSRRLRFQVVRIVSDLFASWAADLNLVFALMPQNIILQAMLA